VNAGEREIVCKKKEEEKGRARGSVHWGCYYATAFDIEVDLQANKPEVSTVDPKTPRAEQGFWEFRMQFVGPGF
jgi:hypothetical protein